jgi:hypothetical protein
MRILHTADWHLADRLGRIDRTDDLRRAVERVAGYYAEEKVGVGVRVRYERDEAAAGQQDQLAALVPHQGPAVWRPPWRGQAAQLRHLEFDLPGLGLDPPGVDDRIGPSYVLIVRAIGP